MLRVSVLLLSAQKVFLALMAELIVLLIKRCLHVRMSGPSTGLQQPLNLYIIPPMNGVLCCLIYLLTF